MTKKHEELVEEIAQDILEYYRPDGFVEVMKWDREFVENLITLIASAFHDGRLDEELGVVGRGIITCTTDGREIYQTDWKGRIPVDLLAIKQQHAWSVYDFIALRKEDMANDSR